MGDGILERCLHLNRGPNDDGGAGHACVVDGDLPTRPTNCQWLTRGRNSDTSLAKEAPREARVRLPVWVDGIEFLECNSLLA